MEQRVFSNYQRWMRRRHSLAWVGSLLGLVLLIACPAWAGSRTITLTGRVDQDTIRVEANGAAATLIAGNPLASFSASVLLMEGSNTLTITAMDRAGNTSTSSIQVSLDSTPPAMAIMAPADGQTMSGVSISLMATASDTGSGVAGVQFLLDGASLGAEDPSAPYSLSWDTTTTPDGAHTLGAFARDAAGNSASAATVNVTVANGPPPSGVSHYIDNSCAVNGNGSAPACAAAAGGAGPWNSLAGTTCSGVRPGDTIELRARRACTATSVCPCINGYCAYEQAPGSVYTWNVPAACGGAPGNPVTIQNFAGEDVVIQGTKDVARGSIWNPIGSGVYECTDTRCGVITSFPFTAWYDLGDGGGERKLTVFQSESGNNYACSTADGPQAGEMRIRMSCSNNPSITCSGSNQCGAGGLCVGTGMCAQLANQSDPDQAAYFRIPAVERVVRLWLYGIDHLTMRKNPGGGSLSIQRALNSGIQLAQSNEDITLDGLDVSWVMNRGIEIGGASAPSSPSGVRIINNRVHHVGQEGIRHGSDTSPQGLVEGNEIFEIGAEPLFEECGMPIGSPIGCLQGFSDGAVAIRWLSQNGAIRNNTIHDIGESPAGQGVAINLEQADPNVGINNTTVEGNLIYNVNEAYNNGGYAISISGAVLDSVDGVVIRNNRMHNVDECIRFKSAAVVRGNARVENNTCSEPEVTGLRKTGNQDYVGSVAFTNNLVTATTRTPSLSLISIEPAFTSAFNLPVSNALYCPSCSNVVRWKGTNYTSSQIPSFGTGNVYGDPNIDQAGTPPSLKIRSALGSALDRGLSLTGFSTDFEGDARPQGAGWDIGADELAGTTHYIALAGDDANPGTQAAPWASLGPHVDGQGTDDLRPGDTVLIEPGVYRLTGPIYFNLLGDLGRTTRIIGQGPGKSIFDGQGLVPRLLKDVQVQTKDKHNVLFRNVAFRNTCTTNCTEGPRGISVNRTHGWTFDDVEVYNIGVAEGVAHSGTSCYVDPGGWSQAIAFVGGTYSENLTITNSKFYNICEWKYGQSGGFGFRYTDNSVNLRIENSELWNVDEAFHFHGGWRQGPSSISLIGNRIGVHPDQAIQVLCGGFACTNNTPPYPVYDGVLVKDNVCVGHEPVVRGDGTTAYRGFAWGVGNHQTPCEAIRNVRFEGNVVKQFATGFLIGRDVNSYGDVTLVNNTLIDIRDQWSAGHFSGAFAIDNPPLGPTATLRMEHNTISRSKNAFYLQGANTANVAIRNNLVAGTEFAHVRIAPDAMANLGTLDIDYNLYDKAGSGPSDPSYAFVVGNVVYGPGDFGTYQAATGLDANSLVGTAQLADPDNGDVHLQPTSPAIDQGIATATVTEDFEGDPRPQGAGWDIGADERR